MSLLRSPSLNPSSLSIPSFLPSRTLTNFPNLPLYPSRYYVHATILRCNTSPRPLPATEQEVLDAIAYSEDENALPCVRTYENELAQLSLVGAVDFQQALTAAAADGGEAASEHVQSGEATMVVETVFPGAPEDRSTISTRLFLPARKVKEKAKRLRGSFSKEMMNSTTSRNILAMTFRQVVLQQLWSFQFVLFGPGTERNMEDLENPREVTATFTLSSSDQRAISVLAEAVCAVFLQSTEEQFLDSSGKSSDGLFKLSRRNREFSSKDSTVTIYKISEDDIVQNAKPLLETFNSAKRTSRTLNTRRKNAKWKPSTLSSLEKIGGPEFCYWLSEYLPVYRLQIKPGRFQDLKFEYGMQLDENRQEVVLTQSQMVGLTNVLDMYYEDVYTLPDKELSCSLAMNSSTFSNRNISSVLKAFSVAIVAAIVLMTIRIIGPTRLLQLPWEAKHFRESISLPSDEADR